MDRIESPAFLFLAFVVLVPFIWRARDKISLKISSIHLIRSSPALGRSIVFALQDVCWVIAVILLALVAAGPSHLIKNTFEEKEVRQISLSIDCSTSMSPIVGRIKEIVTEFVEKRKGDEISITVYSGNRGQEGGAGILRTLTSNTADVKAAVARVEPKMLGIFTALGEGIFASTMSLINERMEYLRDEEGINLYSRNLRDAIKNPNESGNAKYLDFFCETIGPRKNQIIILFTDGIYNTGIHPKSSIELAKRLGIKLYMVALKPRSATGVSKEEGEQRMKEIEEATEGSGGMYFDGEDCDDIARIYQEIDKIERAKIIVRQAEGYKDSSYFYAMLSLAFIVGYFGSKYIFLKFP